MDGLKDDGVSESVKNFYISHQKNVISIVHPAISFFNCQAWLLFISAQISEIHFQSLHPETKRAELTLKSQCTTTNNNKSKFIRNAKFQKRKKVRNFHNIGSPPQLLKVVNDLKKISLSACLFKFSNDQALFDMICLVS